MALAIKAGVMNLRIRLTASASSLVSMSWTSQSIAVVGNFSIPPLRRVSVTISLIRLVFMECSFCPQTNGFGAVEWIGLIKMENKAERFIHRTWMVKVSPLPRAQPPAFGLYGCAREIGSSLPSQTRRRVRPSHLEVMFVFLSCFLERIDGPGSHPYPPSRMEEEAAFPRHGFSRNKPEYFRNREAVPNRVRLDGWF